MPSGSADRLSTHGSSRAITGGRDSVSPSWPPRVSRRTVTPACINAALVAAFAVYGAISSAGRHLPGALVWLVLYSFLAWRIWRYRSSGARDVLLVFSALGTLLLIRAVFRWSPDLLGASGLFTAQFVLLLSPAIRRHVRAKPPRQHFPAPAQHKQDTEEGQPRAKLATQDELVVHGVTRVGGSGRSQPGSRRSDGAGTGFSSACA